MSSGNFHDRASLFMFAPLAIASVEFGLPSVAIMSGYVMGFLWLSPDMDLEHSNPMNRWYLLKIIWLPYHKTHRHRGISHFPIVGSALRLLYLFLLLYFMAGLVNSFGAGIDTISIDWEWLAYFYVGVEVACLLHLVCDYTFLNRW